MYTKNDQIGRSGGFFIPSNYRGNALYLEQLRGITDMTDTEPCVKEENRRTDTDSHVKESCKKCKSSDSDRRQHGYEHENEHKHEHELVCDAQRDRERDCECENKHEHDLRHGREGENSSLLQSIFGNSMKNDNLLIFFLLFFLLSSNKDKDQSRCDDNTFLLLVLVLLF